VAKLRENTASLLQDAAHKFNNTIAIGALIYVKTQWPFQAQATPLCLICADPPYT
jgi:hypothetical protein